MNFIKRYRIKKISFEEIIYINGIDDISCTTKVTIINQQFKNQKS